MELHIVNAAIGINDNCPTDNLEHCVSVVGILYTDEDLPTAVEDTELTRVL